MFINYITTALTVAGIAFAADSSASSVERMFYTILCMYYRFVLTITAVIIEIGNPNATIVPVETSSKVVLTDIQGGEGPTVVPGSTTGIAIIGDKTYTAGVPQKQTAETQST